jgi:hypothetical protein
MRLVGSARPVVRCAVRRGARCRARSPAAVQEDPLMRGYWLLLAIGMLLCAGCAHVDYVGESYAPTTQVDVYYSEANVPREYVVIGEVIATGDEWVSSGKMQEKIRREALKHGAHAVILTSLEKYASGEHSSWSQDQKTSEDKKGRTRTKTTGSSNTSTDETKKIRALFIRYKEPGPAAPAPDAH